MQGSILGLGGLLLLTTFPRPAAAPAAAPTYPSASERYGGPSVVDPGSRLPVGQEEEAYEGRSVVGLHIPGEGLPVVCIVVTSAVTC